MNENNSEKELNEAIKRLKQEIAIYEDNVAWAKNFNKLKTYDPDTCNTEFLADKIVEEEPAPPELIAGLGAWKREIVDDDHQQKKKPIKKISWIILTFNRLEVVNAAFKHNLDSMGIDIDDDRLEIIWVDNGSFGLEVPCELIHLSTFSDVKIFNKYNLGVAKGYNRGIAMATGDMIAITGCDRLMPKNWLKNALDAHDRIHDTGIISYYSHRVDEVKERERGSAYTVAVMMSGTKTFHHHHIQHVMPMEARILSRELHHKIGYLHEGLGLYGWEDILWGERAEKVTAKMGLINYTFPAEVAVHLGQEGVNDWVCESMDDKEYHAFKQRESQDPEKTKICDEYRKAGHPYLNPYI